MKEVRNLSVSLLIIIIATAVSAGCGRTSTPDTRAVGTTDDALIEISIDARDPGELLEFYVNSFAGNQSAIVVDGDRFFVNVDNIAPSFRDQVSAIGSDGMISWEEFEPFVNGEYYAASGAEPTLARLRERAGNWKADDSWFHMSVSGVMTSAKREIYIAKSVLHEAIRSFSAGDGLIYPVGSVFVAEHYDGGELTEVTTMAKRPDSHWDFAAYDPAGNLKATTLPAPKAYNIPSQCVGCHYGSRSFEPERSYPAAAAKGPTGERVIHEPAVRASATLVGHFDEHRRRTDTVLGLYATTYVASLQSRQTQSLTDNERDLLELVQVQ